MQNHWHCIIFQGHLSLRFSTLVQKLWSGKFSALHPKAFKTTLGVLHPQFADNRQVVGEQIIVINTIIIHSTLTTDKVKHFNRTDR